MDDHSNATAVLSIRITPDERRLIEEAAAKKGWKPANFIRVSALERAAQALNLSRPTSFDFSGAAKRFAEALVAPRDVSILDTNSLDEGLGRFGKGAVEFPDNDKVTLADVYLDDFRPAPLTQEEVGTLQTAMRLGGAEFAAELVVECRRLGNAANDPSLPPPIDPQNLKD